VSVSKSTTVCNCCCCPVACGHEQPDAVIPCSVWCLKSYYIVPTKQLSFSGWHRTLVLTLQLLITIRGTAGCDDFLQRLRPVAADC
jgi:hypothetical protein